MASMRRVTTKPPTILMVAISTEIQKNPFSDWLSNRAAAAGITSRAPTRILSAVPKNRPAY